MKKNYSLNRDLGFIIQIKKIMTKMKMTLFVILLSAVQLLASEGYSQNTRFNIDEKNVSIEQVLNSIENQSDYYFIYNGKLINVLQKININVENKDLEKTLDALLNDTNISYRIVNRQVILFMNKSDSIVQQQKTLTGKVTDTSGSPIPGVAVVVKGTAKGVITDINGVYSLANIPSDAQLQFSFMGMKTQDVAVANQSLIDITLMPDAIGIDEVVAIGYGTARKKDLTGAISSVNTKNTELIPNANAVQSLRGTVAGVTITDNGRPGSDATILIRGRNSISASNNPLIVLDGIIYTGGKLSDISSDDIESINILKDASSTAVYGSLAANGVIEITTKKGKIGEPKISLNTYYGTSDYAHIPDMLNAEQYLAVRKDAEAADGGEVPFQPLELENIAAGNIINPFDEIKQDAPMYNIDMSVSGRTDRVKYYMSGSYIDTKSPVLGDNFSRISGRLNLETSITDWLTIGLNTAYSSRDNSGVRASLEYATFVSPYASLYYDDGVARQLPENIGAIPSPIFWALKNKNLTKSNTLFVNSFADIKLPISGLSYRLNLGFTKRDDKNFNYSPSFDREEFFNLGSGNKTLGQSQNLTVENIVKFSRYIGTDHQVTATLLYGIYKYRDESSFLSSNNIFNDALGWNSLEIGSNYNISTGADKDQQVSSMGRIGYRYLGRYIIDGSIRRDGYSAFGKGKKYGVFPSAGISWIMSEEDFLSSADFLENLKFRISWGQNGNRGVSPYSSLSKVSSTNYVFGDGQGSSVGLYTSSMANPNLGWETTRSTNIGIDFGLLSNRISGSIDYYRSRTSDLLLNQKIPNTNGFENFLRNVGETKNKGLEISLNTVNVEVNDFNWSSNIVFTLNRNKIVKLTGNDLNGDGVEDDDITSGWFIGHPLGSYFDYVFDGIYQEGDDFSALAGAKAGDVKFKDIDNDGKITPSDRRVVYSSEPDFTIGITNTFSYKGFSLMAILNIRQGGYSPNSLLNPGTNFYDYMNLLDLPYWTPENPINNYAAINYKNPLSYRFYQSRSYVRLQDVSIGYTVPKAIVQRARLQSMQLYVSGKNLATWTDWVGWDPEYGGGSRNPGNNGPLMKTFTVGVKVQF